MSDGSHRGCLQDIFNYHHLTLEIKVVLRASHIPFRSADRFQYLADLHIHYQWVMSDQLRQDEFQAWSQVQGRRRWYRVAGTQLAHLQLYCTEDPTCKLCKTGEDAREHFLPTSVCYLGVAALCSLLLAIHVAIDVDIGPKYILYSKRHACAF